MMNLYNLVENNRGNVFSTDIPHDEPLLPNGNSPSISMKLMPQNTKQSFAVVQCCRQEYLDNIIGTVKP